MSTDSIAPLHMIDILRKKRDGGALDEREIQFVARGAADGSVPVDQLAAWLMAAWIRGLSRDETRALTLAMRDSGVKFAPKNLGKRTVDKHSSGGVGDKTSFLVAPLAAACGVAVPMISGRALGHTGGTLDKLEAIPGYRTALTLAEFEAVIAKCGASIIGQTDQLAPADRKLYALRDHTATVENPGLICASILSKKLAAGLNGLVLDVKTGSGAFLRRVEDAEFLAALMVATAESAGTETVALLTDMSQPLGRGAGNWIELVECVELLRGARPAWSEDLRELSLILAGWMIHLGRKAETPEAGYQLAEAALTDGAGLAAFMKMVDAQGGDVSVFDNMESFHKPGATLEVDAWQSGYVAEMDTTALGWAVQRTGAGREKAGEPVDPHAGILFHARRSAHVEKGQPFATIYATTEAMLLEPSELLRGAITISANPPEFVPLVGSIITRENAENYLRNAVD
ncbi:MAG: thymidine phosphorylase [Terracidiphilus sp.]|jgi:pyrimidine-nucleoside phosphorylase